MAVEQSSLGNGPVYLGVLQRVNVDVWGRPQAAHNVAIVAACDENLQHAE
jgi:hypothetical protein